MKVSVGILYEQLKKDIVSAVDTAYANSGLPAFLVVAALKEVMCKYDADITSALVSDYQSLLSEVSKDKESDNAESIHKD